MNESEEKSSCDHKYVKEVSVLRRILNSQGMDRAMARDMISETSEQDIKDIKEELKSGKENEHVRKVLDSARIDKLAKAYAECMKNELEKSVCVAAIKNVFLSNGFKESQFTEKLLKKIQRKSELIGGESHQVVIGLILKDFFDFCQI